MQARSSGFPATKKSHFRQAGCRRKPTRYRGVSPAIPANHGSASVVQQLDRGTVHTQGSEQIRTGDKRCWALRRKVSKPSIDDEALTRGAAIAFYTVTSIGPLLFIVVAIAG